MKIKMKSHLFVLLTLIFSFSAFAQNQNETPAPSPTVSPTPVSEAAVIEDDEVLRVDTEEISLNVRVVDANNRPVNSLKQTDFKVYENDQLQTITYFTTAEIQTNYGLVIDNSRSLRAQLDKIIEAGKFIVSTNRPKDETTIVRFVSADKIEVVRDFTTNKGLLGESLNNLFVEGGQTAIIDAVYQTAKRVNEYQKSAAGKDDFKRRALIVVSDGDDRASLRKEQELIELLRRSEVQIYAIGFTNELSDRAGEETGEPSRREKARAFLNRLARETGGKAYFPETLDELPAIAADISSDLRTQYLITYSPASEQSGGGGGKSGFRNIKVTVSDGADNVKRTAITRTGRTASGN